MPTSSVATPSAYATTPTIANTAIDSADTIDGVDERGDLGQPAGA